MNSHRLSVKKYIVMTVTQWRLSLAIALSVCVSAAPAFAVTVEPSIPSVWATIGGQAATPTTAMSWSYDQTTNIHSLAAPVTYESRDTAGNLIGSFTIGGAQARPNPLLLFSVGATNNSANPLAYSFSFNTPLAPNLMGLWASSAELGVTLTDGLNNGATVQPTVPGGKMLTSFDLYSNGTPISKNVDVGDLFSIVGGTSGTTFTQTGSLTCSQACVTMSAILSFTLTGQDSAGFSGKLSQVPLPAAMWLFGSGLLSLGGALARRVNG